MFTKKYEHYYKRLKLSCIDHNLPVAFYELPAVHHSVTISGTDDPRFTKQNFILSCLDRYKHPIVYLDIDTVICQYPYLFDLIDTDLAIYNWLADIENTAYNYSKQHNAYIPINEIRHYSQEQLVSTGPVSFWKPTDSSKMLLSKVIDFLAITPYASDDHAIDIMFNFRDFDITYTWLPKEYVRFPWHPHVKPVILHPDWPAFTQNRPTNNMVMLNHLKCTTRTNLPQNINGYKLYIY
jgi:hypothetical protein